MTRFDVDVEIFLTVRWVEADSPKQACDKVQFADDEGQYVGHALAQGDWSQKIVAARLAEDAP